MKEALRHNLTRLFTPRHVAFIGGRSAELAARKCVDGGFEGPIWGVNPKRRTMAGQPCFASVAELPEGPDAVFLAVPAANVEATLAELRDRGAGGVACYSAGFSETGAAGAEIESRLITAAGDMALIGPNCSGVLNYLEKAALWPFDHGPFAPAENSLARGVAFVTQSGMLGNTVTMNDRSLPFAYIISSGNQKMLGVEDYLEFLIEDPRVTAIALYIEGLRDVARFSRAALKARAAGIPIVAQKVGHSEIGARLTVTHTGSLAGSDSLYQALFDRLGVIRVTSSVAMLETLKLVTLAGMPKGRRIAGFTCSGGDSTMLADGGEALGLTFPAPGPGRTAELRTLLPPIATPGNPLDFTTPLWGQEGPLGKALESFLADPYDAAILVQDFPVLIGGESYEPYLADARAFAKATRAARIPGVVCSILPENLDEEAREYLISLGLAPIQGIEDALAALAAAAEVGALDGDFQARTLPSAPSLPEDATLLDEWEGKRLLAAAGVPVPEGRLCSAEDAPAGAEELGFPVVVKLVHKDLAHKSDAGALKLGLQSADAVAAAVAAIREAVAAYDPELACDRFLVERMVAEPLAEVLVGIRHDPLFGQALVLGSGGVLVELLRDTATLLLPCDRQAVSDALEGLKVAPLLAGFRGKPPADREALIDAILALADFAMARRDNLAELEVNPLMACRQGAFAADVLLRLCDTE